MKIIPVCPYSFGSNTYILLSGSEAIAVDPSVSVRAIDSLLEQQHIAIENQDNTISPSQKFKNAKSASSYKRIGEY